MEGSPLNRLARSALIALVALTCAIGAPTARAQDLTDELVQSTSPDSAAIDTFLNIKVNNLPLLDALTKPDSAAKARKRLGEPLQRSNTRPSSGFRRTYSRAVIAKVGPLTKDPSDDVAVNALRVCGLLGTKEVLDAAGAALDDPREAVRVAAAAALATGLAAQRSDPVLIANQATDVLDKVNVRLGKEGSPRVLEALILVLDSAARIPDKSLPGVRSRAMEILLQQSSALAAKLNGPEFDALFGNIAKAISDALAQTEKFPDRIKQDANKVAADIVARTVHRLDAEPTEAQRTELALVVEQAEFIVRFNGGRKNYGLAALLRAGKDAEFKAKAAELANDAKKSPP